MIAAIIPVHNEVDTLKQVAIGSLKYVDLAIVIDDGSSDGSINEIKDFDKVEIISHPERQGYGKSLLDGFKFCKNNNISYAITIDSDGQHDPSYIPKFIEKSEKYDIVSGTRMHDEQKFPKNRLYINKKVRSVIKKRIDFQITDVFCGFKCYNIDAISKLDLYLFGYEFPIQLIIEANDKKLSWTEINVPNIYLESSRNFNNDFRDDNERLNKYLKVIDKK